MDKDLENRFTYHRPTEAQQKIYPLIRDKAKELAYIIKDNVPNGREQALALTKLEEVVMWANAGVSKEQEQQPTKKDEKTQVEKATTNLYAMFDTDKIKSYSSQDPHFIEEFNDAMSSLIDRLEDNRMDTKFPVESLKRNEYKDVFAKLFGNEYHIQWFRLFSINAKGEFEEVEIDPLKF